MNWFSNILPRVKKRAAGKTVPEGVWTKCARCEAAIYSPQFEKDLWVCASCDHHHRVSAERRMAITLDPDPAPVEIGAHLRTEDFLRFDDGRGYGERLRRAAGDDGRREAARVARGAIEGREVVAAFFDFTFMGGSMGCVAGERFTRGVERAAASGLPFVCFSASGGARMQEGLGALLQMAKTVSALAELDEKRLPFISVLTDPTMGGVAASFAMLGDVNLAEPRALVGFAGPRVIQETVRERLPEGFQRSEFLLEKGAVDAIVPRAKMRPVIASLVDLLRPRRGE